ncbi:MAG: hypothetical protein ACRDKC_00740 [Gaiellaceae bacterium]
MIDRLQHELAVRGVSARRRRRIRLELEDHLACDPAADLGDPVALAQRFVDELGTAFARRAALATFLALAPIGVLAAVLALLSNGTVNVGTILGGQLAFVGGTLALLRAWRLRGAALFSGADATALRRRAFLGIGGGALTLLSIGVVTQRPLALATVALGTLALGTASTALVHALRVRPVAAGTSRDLSFDLGLDADPWRLALLIASVVALCIAFAGVAQADPFDGLVRAVGDGLLCLAGFALLGRQLGLRS